MSLFLSFHLLAFNKFTHLTYIYLCLAIIIKPIHPVSKEISLLSLLLADSLFILVFVSSLISSLDISLNPTTTRPRCLLAAGPGHYSAAGPGHFSAAGPW